MVDPLPVEYVIPLALTPFNFDGPVEIDDSTRIEPIDELTQMARTPSDFSATAVPDPVISAATHALVLSGHTIANPGPLKRVFRPEVNRDPLPLEEADLVCNALLIATGRDVGFAQVLQRPLGWSDGWKYNLPPVSTVATVRHYPDRFDDRSWHEAPTPIEEKGDDLRDAIKVLRGAPARVQLAARRLGLARSRSAEQDKTVDACIGLEALLGEGRDELTHRLSLRASTALGSRPTDPRDPERVYKLMKKVYAHRSAVVHGATKHKNKTIELEGMDYATADVAILLLYEITAEVLQRGLTPENLDSLLLKSIGILEQNKHPG